MLEKFMRCRAALRLALLIVLIVGITVASGWLLQRVEIFQKRDIFIF